jgi:hypothetical protein
MRVLVLFLVSTCSLLADGGAVLLQREMPPFVVTVFASPTPPRAGMIDLSVLFQTVATLEPVLDADVKLLLTSGEDRLETRATHDGAQNKVMYAAPVLLDHPGNWRFTVTVRPRGSTPVVEAMGVLAIAEREPKLEAYWGYLALPFVCLAVYAVHQRLRWSKEFRGAGARAC